MKKSLLYTYGVLILLTLTTAFVSNSITVSAFAVSIIMGISALKFILVAFQFMELKKANSFWRITLGLVLGLIILVVVTII
ncbi:cytochrome C oxidase subunit IV family protein [Flavobacterium acetivorans]|uniref:cytochrome C oxidase subunit IV family protein n=1 Tax=Flavobacterium acetivorans TaxID=2893883 RepID=UPI001E5B28BF|nr:cytochrome C oxidase subunit IV family protein [Flavobacterium sp. F-29]UFH34422.1 cytochrome C oxidase subunit IV family protein [Flavobacterium sp. F-29]